MTKTKPAGQDTPIGYVVYLANKEEKYFPTATDIRVNTEGGIGIWVEHIHIGHYKKEEYVDFRRVQKERPSRRK